VEQDGARKENSEERSTLASERSKRNVEIQSRHHS